MLFCHCVLLHFDITYYSSFANFQNRDLTFNFKFNNHFYHIFCLVASASKLKGRDNGTRLFL